jgi:hypothetical protein
MGSGRKKRGRIRRRAVQGRNNVEVQERKLQLGRYERDNRSRKRSNRYTRRDNAKRTETEDGRTQLQA